MEYGTHSILEKASPRRHFAKTQQRSQTSILPLHLLDFVQTDRDGESADKHLAGEPRHLLLALAANAGDDRVVATPCRRVIKRIPAHQEDPGKLLVVVGHHRGAGRLLGKGEEVVDVLDGAECFLP